MRHVILSVCFFFALITTGCGKTEEEKKADELKATESRVQAMVAKNEEATKIAMAMIAVKEAEIEAKAKEKAKADAEALAIAERNLESRVRREVRVEVDGLVKKDDTIAKLRKDLEKEREEFHKEKEVFYKKTKAEEEAIKAKLAIFDATVELIKFKMVAPRTKAALDKLVKMEKDITTMVMDMIK